MQKIINVLLRAIGAFICCFIAINISFFIFDSFGIESVFPKAVLAGVLAGTFSHFAVSKFQKR